MPERPRLDAVLLDAGGTLVRLDFEWIEEALANLGARTSAAALRRGEVAGRRAYDEHPSEPPGAGRRIRSYFAAMLEAAGVPAPRVEPAIERLLERDRVTGLWSRPMEGARDCLRRLGEMGLRRAVISNSDGRAEACLRESDVHHGVEIVVDSHRVGVAKPEPAIFGIALEWLGVPAERALFVGDIRSVDEAGARAAGLHFVLLDPHGNYASPGSPAIAEIGELADWVTARFELPAGEGAEGP